MPDSEPLTGTLPATLVVDLDGTLIATDLLYESFWSALADSPLTIGAALTGLTDGRAALKARLAERACIDVTTLPYRSETLAYIERWRGRGGRTALVTAADRRLATAVADHLGLFDEVHGSDGATNLKGIAKADFLSTRFASGFAYIGDSRADAPVWQAAAQPVTVGANAELKAAAGPDAVHIAVAQPRPQDYLRALRPHQWLKNILVFVPAIAAHDVSSGTLATLICAFLAYSLVASAVYVLNDLLDLSADRAHPRKRTRPFASGAVPISHATAMAPGLLLAGAGVALATGSMAFLATLGIYFLLTLAYSMRLKQMLLLDICTLAGLYTLRILAGGLAAEIEISFWLASFSIFIFLSLAAIKRQAELVDLAARNRTDAAGRAYRTDDLPVIAGLAMASGCTSVLVFALFLNDPSVAVLYGAPEVLWGAIPVLLYWIGRMVLLAHRGEMTDDPIVFALRDPASYVCGALLAGVVGLAWMG